MELISDKS